MNKRAFLDRLRQDPAWARDILSHVYKTARQKWQRRWREGKHPQWIQPKETVGEGFRRALESMPADTEFDNVTPYIAAMIDDYIAGLMVDASPSMPRHCPRGAKRRGRGRITNLMHQDYERDDPQEAALAEHIDRHPVQFARVMNEIRAAKLKKALAMFHGRKSAGAIRRETGFTIPMLLERYNRALFGLGLSA